MEYILINLALAVIAYLFGSFPSALVVGKAFRGLDLRKEGSGNLGTTNAIRVLGKKLGFFVFFLDLLKAVIVMLVVVFNAHLFNFNNLWHPMIFGIVSIFGHVYPIFTKFKGGKAVACSLAVCSVITPIPALLCLVVFYITLKISGYVSLSSLNATMTVFIGATIQIFVFGFNAETTAEKWFLFAIYFLMSAFIFYKHRTNIVKLLNGTENNFKKKKQEKKEAELADSH